MEHDRRERADDGPERQVFDRLAGNDVDAVRNGRTVRRDGERTVRGVVIDGEDGNPVKQATWTVINTVKWLL